MKIFLAIFHFAFIFFLASALAKRWGETRSKLYWASFFVHVIAGLCVGLVYLKYYVAGDTWHLFRWSTQLSDVARKDFGEYLKLLFGFSDGSGIPAMNPNFRSRFFIKILSFFSYISLDNYWICSGYFALFSFISSWFLFRKVVIHFPESKLAASLAFLIFPSVVFWTSGLEKETLAQIAIYLLAGIFIQIILDQKVDKLVLTLTLLATTLLVILKYYWAGVFFISTGSAVIVHRLSQKISLIRKQFVIFYLVTFVFLGLIVSFMHPNFNLNRLLEVISSNHDEFVRLSTEGNLIHYNHLDATLSSIFTNAPWALFSGIFRPFITEGNGLLGFAAATENFLILLLFVSFLFRLTKNRPKANILSLAVIVYCIVLCIFLALSTPNLGTLSRYRVGFLPFLIFVLAYRNPLVNMIAKKFIK